MPELTAHDLLITLNRDFNHLTPQIERIEQQIKRGNERFAKIDLHEHGIEAAINELRVDYSRVMVAIERVQSQLQDNDKVINAALRLANKVQNEQQEDFESQRIVMVDLGTAIGRVDIKFDKLFDKLDRKLTMFMVVLAVVLLAMFTFLLVR